MSNCLFALAFAFSLYSLIYSWLIVFVRILLPMTALIYMLWDDAQCSPR